MHRQLPQNHGLQVHHPATLSVYGDLPLLWVYLYLYPFAYLEDQEVKLHPGKTPRLWPHRPVERLMLTTFRKEKKTHTKYSSDNNRHPNGYAKN